MGFQRGHPFTINGTERDHPFTINGVPKGAPLYNKWGSKGGTPLP